MDISSSVTSPGANATQMTEVVEFPRPVMIFAAICASIFTVVGIGGNLLTVVALLRCPKLRLHATTLFVISLAFSDLLFSAVNLPITAVRYANGDWPFDDTMCRLFPFFFYGNVAASLMSMVAITINRYVLIAYHGLYHRIYTRTNITLMIASVWAFSFGIMVPPLTESWGKLGKNNETKSCTILRGDDGRSPKRFLFALGFFLPCVVIVGCYTAMFLKVKQSRKNVQAHQKASGVGSVSKDGVSGDAVSSCKGGSSTGGGIQQSSQQKREDMRLTRMMLTIFLCFLVTFLPLMVVNVADDQMSVPSIHIIASILAWGSAIVNPFIYAFKNRQYQQAFTRVVCFKAMTSSARTVAGLTGGSGKERKRGSGGATGRTGGGSRGGVGGGYDAESGNLQTDKDSKNSTTLKNGSSSKTFLTDTLGRGGGGGGGPGNANATTGSSDNLDLRVGTVAPAPPQAIEMADRSSSPEGKIWCHFPAATTTSK